MQNKQYELSPFPKDVIGIISANCVQKFQGDQTLQLEKNLNKTLQESIYYYILKRKSPAYQLNEQDKLDLEKFQGNTYALCEYRGQEFLKGLFHHEILKFNDCLQVCDIENASNYKGILVIKRSMCRRKCEDALDLTLKNYMKEGKFPTMLEIMKM